MRGARGRRRTGGGAGVTFAATLGLAALAGGCVGDDGDATATASDSASDAELPPACGDGVAAPGEFCFLALDPLLVNDQPTDVVIADLDRDGRDDLAHPALGGTARVFYGTGFGTFDDPPLVMPLIQPRGVAAIGRGPDLPLDLAVADFGLGTLALFRAEGPRDYAGPKGATLGGQPRALASGDLDGDGDDDLAIADQGADTVTIALLGAVDEPPALTTYDVGEEPYGVAIADLDGDGQLDVATADRVAGTVSILRGAGDGSFAAAVSREASPDARNLAIADVDGDGRLDVVTAGFTGQLTILRGLGDLEFAPRVLDDGGMLYGVAVGDLDHDGVADVIATDVGTSEAVLFLELDQETPTIERRRTSSAPFDVAVADLNKDGALDVVVVAAYGNAIDVFINDP